MDRKELVSALIEGHCSCVIRNGSEIRRFYGQGISDLWSLSFADPKFLDGATVVDKVIGKAAAAVLIRSRVNSVHAVTISRHALSLFRDNGMLVDFDTVVDHIVNRKGDGWCPLEALCRNLRTWQECIDAIGLFLKSH